MVIRDRRAACFFFQAEDGIRDRSPSRGLGDVYKRQYIDSTKMKCYDAYIQFDNELKKERRDIDG